MNASPSFWSLSVYLVIVCANFLLRVASQCVDNPSSIILPTQCPIVANSTSLELHKVKNSELPLECSGEGGPAIFVTTNSFVYFHCCFSGYTNIIWQFSPFSVGPFATDPKCISRYDNHTMLAFTRVQAQYSGYYRCEAVGPSGERLSMVQRLSVLLKVEDKSISSPQFHPKCQQEIDIIGGTKVECPLTLNVTRKTKIFIHVMVADQLIFTCIYKPFCDRLLTERLTEAMCHRNRSSNMLIGFKTDPMGSVLRAFLSPIPGPQSNVTFIAWEETLPQETTVWSIHTKPLPPDDFALYIIFSSSICILSCIVLLALVWIFAFNIQLVLKGLRFRLQNVKPCVQILRHSGNAEFVNDLLDYLEESCVMKQDLAGLPDCEIVMSTGLDKTCVVLIILDVPAVSHESFIASMNSLLLRESARRVYVCLDSISDIQKQTAVKKDSLELVKRIKADLNFCRSVCVGRRPWKWVRWQVITCLRLAAISILSKLEPEIMLKPIHQSTSSDSGLGSTSSDF